MLHVGRSSKPGTVPALLSQSARKAYNRGLRLPLTNPCRYENMFLSIDGCDGTGKSTQVDRLCAWLRRRGHDIVACRDPGSTPLGEAVRELLLKQTDLDIRRPSEMLLYMAARAQLVEEIIRPALAAGKIKPGKAQLYGNPPELFLLQPVRVYAGQGLDQAGLAVVDVPCGA